MPAADELLGTASAQALARTVSAAVPGAALPVLKAAENGFQGLSLRERADLLPLGGKTFKLTTATLAPGQSLTVTREHSFRPITTRR